LAPERVVAAIEELAVASNDGSRSRQQVLAHLRQASRCPGRRWWASPARGINIGLMRKSCRRARCIRRRRAI